MFCVKFRTHTHRSLLITFRIKICRVSNLTLLTINSIVLGKSTGYYECVCKFAFILGKYFPLARLDLISEHSWRVVWVSIRSFPQRFRFGDFSSLLQWLYEGLQRFYKIFLVEERISSVGLVTTRSRTQFRFSDLPLIRVILVAIRDGIIWRITDDTSFASRSSSRDYTLLRSE